MFDVETPTYFEQCPRVVVIGDVHGDLGRLTECLYATNVLNQNGEWIADPPNTIVVQLGDQVDSRSRSGPEGDWEKVPDTEVLVFMDRIDRAARIKGGRVISLIGNHEIMNVMGDFTYVSDKSRTPLRAAQFRPDGRFAQLLAKRCVTVKIGSLLFVHAGLLPRHVTDVNGDLHVYNVVMRRYLSGEALGVHEMELLDRNVVGQDGMLWTRMYADASGNELLVDNMISVVLERMGCKLMCTGHNTVQSITGVSRGRLWFVDTGLSRSYSTEAFQVLEILDDGETFRIVEVRKK